MFSWIRRKYLAVLSLEELEEEASTSPTTPTGGGPRSENGGLLVRLPYGGKYEISNTQWAKGDEKLVAVAVSRDKSLIHIDNL